MASRPARRRVVRWVALLLAVLIALGGLFVLYFTAAFSALTSAARGAQEQAAATCSTGVAAAAGGGAAPVVTAGQLSAEQRGHAATIIAVGRDLGVSPRGQVVAIATAMQESTLRNLDYGDRDSLGLFQQRPSQGWGSPAQVRDPRYSSAKFYEGLLAVPGWERMPVTVAAQTVQRSGFPNAYAKWEGLATDVVGSAGPTPRRPTDPAVPSPPSPPSPPPAACAIEPGSPAATQAAATAIAFARDQLGERYVWGGTGPDTWDCSGLVLQAFGAAGVTVPRVSRDQYHTGAHLTVAQAQPGDLLFWARDTGDPRTIYHVALYIGGGRMLEAPNKDNPVRERDIAWTEANLVQQVTRPGTAVV